ncbi:MAG: nucleotidyltransferase domain-containing protein, partial [Chloroflexia bacterium]
MTDSTHPTLYPYVNAVLNGFEADLRSILGDRFRGMYLSGSLALGDFEPQISDIDFIVLTDPRLSNTLIEAVRDLHDSFNMSDSPWAGKIEAVYVTPEALHTNPISSASYPQVEKDRALFVEP